MIKQISDFSEETREWQSDYKGSEIKVPIMDLDERLRQVERRLLIIDPPAQTLAKYPALAEAYREYKLIERLTLGNEES